MVAVGGWESLLICVKGPRRARRLLSSRDAHPRRDRPCRPVSQMSRRLLWASRPPLRRADEGSPGFVRIRDLLLHHTIYHYDYDMANPCPPRRRLLPVDWRDSFVSPDNRHPQQAMTHGRSLSCLQHTPGGGIQTVGLFCCTRGRAQHLLV